VPRRRRVSQLFLHTLFSNLLNFIEGNAIGIHYVSNETAVRIIYLIQLLVEDCGFGIDGILDLGVGSPYLIGALKTIWNESIAIGVDLPEGKLFYIKLECLLYLLV